MRIAIVAPLWETVPPTQYGGTERVVHWVVEELVRLGHTVTLYAARGSKTSAKLIECFSGSFRDQGIKFASKDARDASTAQLKLAMSGWADHDIVHIHHGVDPYHPEVMASCQSLPVVWTDHNAVHNLDKPRIFQSLAKLDIEFTALSESQRGTVPDAPWLSTIHHGLPVNMLTPSTVNPTYLAFLGRISPEKGITTAVRISEAAGHELKVAAKVDDVDRPFYETEVKPIFAASRVDFIGEISDAQKGPFLSAAIALLFPICWLEPFGLVMIEAMACGCPIIAFRMGSVPEIVEDGVTGFVVDTEEEAVEALRHVGSLDRKHIRRRFEEKFTSTTMTKMYVDAYERIIERAQAVQDTNDLQRGLAVQESGFGKRPGLFSARLGPALVGSSLPVWTPPQLGDPTTPVSTPVSTLVSAFI